MTNCFLSWALCEQSAAASLSSGLSACALHARSSRRSASVRPSASEYASRVSSADAPVAYQVILEPGTGQIRAFEPPRVHTRVNSWGLFLVHKMTCGKRESVS